MKAPKVRGIRTAPDGVNTAPAPLQWDASALPDQAPADPTPGAVELPDKPPALETAFHAASKTDPDRAAQVIAISERMGEPEKFIDRNLEDAKKIIAQPATSLFHEIESQYPGTTKFLMDPRNMAVSHDDIQNVAQHEAILKNMKESHGWMDALRSGFQTSAASLLTGPPELKPPADPSVMESFLSGAGKLAGDFPFMIAGGIAGTVAGASVGAVAGSPFAGIPGAAAGAMMGGAAGGASGAFAAPAMFSKALMDRYEKGDIQGVTDLMRRIYDVGLEGFKQGAVGLATAGVGGLAGKVAGPAIVKTGAKLAAEVGTMTVAGKAVEGQLPAPRDFLDGALLVGAMHAAGVPAGKALNYWAEGVKAERVKNFYTALGDTAEAAKLRERMPESHRQLIASITANGPVENVYIPAERFDEFFQSKGLNPDEVAQELGVTKSHSEARQTGDSVEIPLATWAQRAAGELYRGLADDVKFSPDDLTVREAGDRRAQIHEELKGVEAERQAEAEAAKPAEVDPVKQIQEGIAQRLKDAGLSATEAKHNSEVHGAIWKTLAKIHGVDPAKLSEQFPLKIGQDESPPAASEQSSAQGKVFDQGTPNEARGRIRIGPDSAAIDLFKSRDKSTFLHESGHYFLDVLGKLSADEASPQALKDDYQAILKWLGVDSKDQIGTEHHEKFARGFEAYHMEGKAPSEALRRAFQKFKDWLTTIYKHVSHLKVELTPEIRGVMDRMMASQEEIARAHREIGDPGQPIEGLPKDVQSRIESLQLRAREQAERSLMTEQMKETEAKHVEFLAKERERLTDKAKDDVAELPVFKAGEDLVAAITKHKSADTIAEKFLADKLKDHEAASVEALAEIHGFKDGEEMSKAIILAKEQGTFEREVQARVEAGMAEHAPLMDKEAIKAEALKAVHGERMTELLALEHQALTDMIKDAVVKSEVSRRNRIEARLDAKTAIEQARAIIADKPVKDAVKAGPYVTAERNAAVRVAQALVKKDYDAAATAKRQQMLNHALASEAIRAQGEAKKSLSYLKDAANRGRDLMDMPYGFTRQVDQLLSRFGLSDARAEDSATLLKIATDMAAKGEDPGEISNSTGLRQNQSGQWVPETLPDFVARVNEGYTALTIPDAAYSGGRSFRELKLSELRDLKEAVQSIAKAGKDSNRWLSFADKVDMKEAAAKLVASIRENHGTPFAESMKPGAVADQTQVAKWFEKLLQFKAGALRSLDTMLTTTDKLDGLKEGPAKDFIYRPLADAENREMARKSKVMKELDGIFADHYKLEDFAQYKEKKVRVAGRDFTKAEVLAMALNWGNEGNRDRLMRGFGWDQATVEGAFKALGKNDWDFVQATWDHLHQYWPEISKLEMDVNGVEPRGVEPAAFQNEHGSYKGGYYPIAYDFERSADAYQNALQRDALYKNFSVAKAHTDQGHAQARVSQVTRPLKLSLDVLRQHHEDVIHDLEFRRAVIDVNRFLNLKDVKQALSEAIGVRGHAEIMDWLKNVAGAGGESANWFEQQFRSFRFATSMYNLGFRIVSAPKIAGENLINIASEVGIGNASRALKDFYFGDGVAKDTVKEKSAFMSERAKHIDRDFSDIQKKWEGTAKASVMQHAFFVHAFLDESVSFPLWSDVYQRAIADHGNEKLAVTQADEAVKRTFMSTGAGVDRPNVMRGSESWKALTTAYGYMNMMWNRFSRTNFAIGQEWAQGNHIAAAAITARAAAYTFFLPATLVALTRELLHNSQHTTDDERKKRMLVTLTEELSPAKFIPVLRDISPLVIKKAAGEHAGHLQSTPLEGAIETLLANPAQDLGTLARTGRMPDKALEHAANAASFYFGVPKQLNDITFNFLDWMNHNGDATWRDFMSRKTKK